MSEQRQSRYAAETNAAWYALAPFINPLDCSKRVHFRDEGGKLRSIVKPLNLNDDLDRFFNGELRDGAAFSPTWFSKKRLEDHLLGGEDYYYRSAYNGMPRSGYGNSARVAAAKLGFDPELLGVRGKARRFPQIGVVLVCADIDCHRGETDGQQVAQWLLDRYFPGCYAEPSTGGKGVHLYVKLAYDPFRFRYRDDTLRHVVETMNALAEKIDLERAESGFQAPVDGLRGLPSQIVPDGNRVRIRRSSCIKLPRFPGGMKDIVAFHAAPFFLCSYFERSISEVSEETLPVSSSPASAALVNRALSLNLEPATLPAELRVSGAGAKALNSVYPSYEQRLRELAAAADAYDRGLGFMLAYSRHLRRVPSVEEALAEYEARGLNTGDDRSERRRSRFDYLARFVVKTFDPSKAGFNYAGFESERERLRLEVSGQMHCASSLEFAKDKGRTETVGIEDLAVLLFAMRKSQGARGSTEFGYQHVRTAFVEIKGTFGSRNKAQCLLRALKDMGFIERVGNHQAGARSRKWRVN